MKIKQKIEYHVLKPVVGVTAMGSSPYYSLMMRGTVLMWKWWYRLHA